MCTFCAEIEGYVTQTDGHVRQTLPSGYWRAQPAKAASNHRLNQDAYLTRNRTIEFRRDRAEYGADRTTLAIDISVLSAVLQYGAALYGYQVPIEQTRLGRVANVRLSRVAKIHSCSNR